MNPAGQPGQMAPGQSNGQQPQRPTLFKPNDMDHSSITDVITDAEKVKFKEGLTALWGQINNLPADSPQRQVAYKKIVEFSANLRGRIRIHAASAASNNAPSGAAGGAPGPVPAAAGGANAQGQQPQQGNRPAAQGINPQIRQHTTDTVQFAPQEIVDQGPEAVNQYLTMQRQRYGSAVMKMQQMTMIIQSSEPKLQMLRQKGAAVTPDEQRIATEMATRLQQAKLTHQNAKTQMEAIRKEQVALKEAKAAAANGAGSDVTANQAARPGQQPGAANNTNTPQQNTGVDPSKPQPTGGASRIAGGNAQSGQQSVQSTQPPQASPVTTTQNMPQQQIKMEPGLSQQGQGHVPPPVNTALGNSAGAGAGMPSAGTPTQARMPPTPIQSATPTTGAPHPLSHTAALNLANQNRNLQQPVNPNMTSQPQQGTPQGTPSSAGVMGSTAQQPGHSHAHPGQQQPQATLPTKLPVPKVLPEKAAMAPQPVNTNVGGVGPGRPTYTQGGGTAGGVMSQPILPKIPQISMENEGERVLNRKKLDDIVRQVCGGQAEGQEGNALTPEVEEAVLTMADSFVDSLLHSACAIAKQRGSKVLEIRDIQLVLERTYNIRIPGYATDELRAVRKVQPAVGWLTKISAIQASKVTGNKEF